MNYKENFQERPAKVLPQVIMLTPAKVLPQVMLTMALSQYLSVHRITE